MSYWDTALMANDGELWQREIACAATEGIDDPQNWADAHRWQLAGQPGWGDAWSSALAAGNPTPGRDPAVIPDAWILAGVQALNNVP